MIIKTKELRKMLKEYGRQYTIMMYINRFIHLTDKQLDYVMRYKNEKTRQTIVKNKM